MMIRYRSLAVSLAGILMVTPAHSQGVSVHADILGEGGKGLGSVSLNRAPRGVLLRVQVSGLAPGWHGMHIHSVATCADQGFKASGGHVHAVSAATSVHGLLNANETDLGDLPNIYAGADGNAAAEVFDPNVSLGEAPGRTNLLDADGSALIIHASPDDHVSQPIGGAGARIACAAIK